MFFGFIQHLPIPYTINHFTYMASLIKWKALPYHNDIQIISTETIKNTYPTAAHTWGLATQALYRGKSDACRSARWRSETTAWFQCTACQVTCNITKLHCHQPFHLRLEYTYTNYPTKYQLLLLRHCYYFSVTHKHQVLLLKWQLIDCMNKYVHFSVYVIVFNKKKYPETHSTTLTTEIPNV